MVKQSYKQFNLLYDMFGYVSISTLNCSKNLINYLLFNEIQVSLKFSLVIYNIFEV